MTVLPFTPRRVPVAPPSSPVLPRSALPSGTATLDVLAAFEKIRLARAGGTPLPPLASVRDGLVRVAAEALVELDDVDRGES